MQKDRAVLLTDGVVEVALIGAAAVVHEFASAERTFEEALAATVSIAGDALGADAASVTWIQDRRRVATVASTDPVALEVDEAQYRSRRGPCLVAAREAHRIRVDDVGQAVDWPEFADAAAKRRIRSSVSIPVHAGVEMGALNLYGQNPGQFAVTSPVLQDALAAHAAVVGRLHRERQTTEQMAAALQARSVIEQAKGVIMAAQGCDADAAFNTLVRQSQYENRKLREIAAEIVARQRRP